jgi:Peptidase family M23
MRDVYMGGYQGGRSPPCLLKTRKIMKETFIFLSLKNVIHQLIKQLLPRGINQVKNYLSGISSLNEKTAVFTIIKRRLIIVSTVIIGSSPFVLMPALFHNNSGVAQAQVRDLFCTPTTQNPLRGFQDPLNGDGTLTRSSHPDIVQKFADDVGGWKGKTGAPIYNMRKGKVTQVVDSFPDAKGKSATGLKVNRIIIEIIDSPLCIYKRDGRQSTKMKYDMLYLHVEQNSSKVRVGDIIEAGHHIANVGNNGDSSSAHLHVEVAATTGRNWFDRLTVPYLWDSNRNK